MATPGLSQAQGRAERSIKKNDVDGDGRVSRDEWRKGGRRFKKIDTDRDGYITLEEFRERFDETAGEEESASEPETLLDGQTTRDALDEETLCAIGRSRRCDINVAIDRGLFETGLRPVFPENAECRDIDEQYAISYTYKRNRENYHGGIDMPAPWGTPMIAVAAGTVVAKFRGEKTHRGIEIWLRHSPEDTGIPFWIYTQYTHFDEMPKLDVGQRVSMGEVLGPTGNTGISTRTGVQSTRRRPAIHFAVFYTESDQFVVLRNKVVPVESYWMDPNALFRKEPPFDSHSMKALPDEEQQIPVSVMFEDGETVPTDTKIVWPYTCERG